jgi:hypothetical protein
MWLFLDFDDEKKRNLALVSETANPTSWDVLPETIKEGEIVKGQGGKY